MSRYLDGQYQKFAEYTPGEQPRDQVYTKLNTNESPYPAGPKTIAAVCDPEAAGRLRLYSDPTQLRLREALAARYGVQPGNVFVGNGSDEILYIAFLAFGQDGVLFPRVSYGFYEVFAEMTGRSYQKIDLREDFTIDVSDYLAPENLEGGKLIVLANPNAPTGIALGLDEIRQLLEGNPDHVVVVDEAYVDFGAESAVSLLSEYDNLLVCRTYSKSRSMAGARLGFSFSSEALARDLEKLKYSINPYNVNSLTSAAGIAALSEDDYYMGNCRRIMETREWTAEELKKLGFRVLPSRANFLFARPPRISGGTLYEQLKARGVLVRHFSDPLITDFVRITVGTKAQMELLLRETAGILAAAKGEKE